MLPTKKTGPTTPFFPIAAQTETFGECNGTEAYTDEICAPKQSRKINRQKTEANQNLQNSIDGSSRNLVRKFSGNLSLA